MQPSAKKFTIFCYFHVTPQWLELTKDQRTAVRDRAFVPIFMRYREQVSIRLFDTWAFTHTSTDVIMFETPNLLAYYALMDELKNTEIFSKDLLKRGETIVAVEDGFLG
jgi:hypothetical protein